MKITTWADGYGLWHARVTEPSNTVGDSYSAELAARDAIRAELTVRESPKFDPETVDVTLDHRDSFMGDLVSYFDEVRAAPRLQRNDNGSWYCWDCRHVVILFDDDEHACDVTGTSTHLHAEHV